MLACVVLTTMGRVLLQCEHDTTLPLHFSRLALVLASLLQFATSRQDFARVELRNELCIVLSVDAAESVACAVIYSVRDSNPPAAADERARLMSLVVLREFLASFRDTVERIIDQNRADAEQMAEAYTLTSALEGGGSSGDIGDAGDGDGSDGTMAPFVGFHHDVVRRLLETTHVARLIAVETKGEKMRVLRCYVMNAETGVSLASEEDESVEAANDATATERSYPVQQLVKRAARALQLAFPVLYHTSLLKRRSTILSAGSAARDGLANASISATTLVLRLKSPGSATHHDVVLQMYHYGVFTAVVHFETGSDRGSFRGRDCELLRDGALQRVLISDPRGAALTQLLHEAETATSFALHVGSDGASAEALAAAEQALRPWTLPSTVPHAHGS